MKKHLLALAALAAASFTFAAETKAPDDKPKADAKCDSCCSDDPKPPAPQDAKASDAKADPKKSDAAQPAEKK